MGLVSGGARPCLSTLGNGPPTELRISIGGPGMGEGIEDLASWYEITYTTI